MNNFDTNSKGDNIEFNIFYDVFQGQENFTENFKEHDEFKAWIYTDCGQVKTEPEWGINFKNHTNKQILLEIYLLSSCSNYKEFKEDYFNNSHWKQLTATDLLDIFTEILDAEYYQCEQLEVLHDLDFIYFNHHEVSIIGYSQGDYADIIIMDETINNMSDKLTLDEKLKLIQKLCQHYFFDAPIYGTVTINNEEHYVDEFLKSQYEWDKDNFIKSFLKSHPELSKIEIELTEMLPTDLEHIS